MWRPTLKKELLEQFVDGSNLAFEELYKLYKPFVRFCIEKEIPNGDTDDIEQEIWLKLCRARKRILILSAPAYILTIIKNVITDMKRKFQSQMTTKRFSEINHELEKQNGSDYIPIEDTIIDPNSELNEKEIEGRQDKIDKVRYTLKLLPEKYASILRMVYNENMPYEKIADILQIPLGTVKSRINTAKKLFQDKYCETTRKL